jgi:cell division protein ZapA
MQQIDVKILDRDYKLAVDEADKPRLVDAARVVDEKMRSIRDAGRVNGVDRIAVMAALQLAHELLSKPSGTAQTPVSGEVLKRIRKMTEDLDAEFKRQESLF